MGRDRVADDETTDTETETDEERSHESSETEETEPTTDQPTRAEIAGALGVALDDPQVAETLVGIQIREQVREHLDARPSATPDAQQTVQDSLAKYPGATIDDKLDAQTKDLLAQLLKDKGITEADLTKGYKIEKVTDHELGKTREVEEFLPSGKGPGDGTYINTKINEFKDGRKLETIIRTAPGQPAEILRRGWDGGDLVSSSRTKLTENGPTTEVLRGPPGPSQKDLDDFHKKIGFDGDGTGVGTDDGTGAGTGNGSSPAKLGDGHPDDDTGDSDPLGSDPDEWNSFPDSSSSGGSDSSDLSAPPLVNAPDSNTDAGASKPHTVDPTSDDGDMEAVWLPPLSDSPPVLVGDAESGYHAEGSESSDTTGSGTDGSDGSGSDTGSSDSDGSSDDDSDDDDDEEESEEDDNEEDEEEYRPAESDDADIDWSRLDRPTRLDMLGHPTNTGEGGVGVDADGDGRPDLIRVAGGGVTDPNPDAEPLLVQAPGPSRLDMLGHPTNPGTGDGGVVVDGDGDGAPDFIPGVGPGGVDPVAMGPDTATLGDAPPGADAPTAVVESGVALAPDAGLDAARADAPPTIEVGAAQAPDGGDFAAPAPDAPAPDGGPPPGADYDDDLAEGGDIPQIGG